MEKTDSKKAVSGSKRTLYVLAGLVLIAALVVVLTNKKENAELSSLSESIQALTDAGEYKEALSEAKSIQYKGKLSWRSAQKWSAERESLIASVQAARDADLEENGVSFPVAASVLVGTSAEEALDLLSEAGFTNIEENELPYERSVYYDPGDITEITVDGARDVYAGDLFFSDAPVVISFYSMNAQESSEVEVERYIGTYRGKKLSILGDSISTFKGYIPEENEYYYNGKNAGITSVNDLWWAKLADALGMELEVNNSWNATRVSTTGRLADVAGCLRCEDLGDDPDVIIVSMGVNDFICNVSLGNYNGVGPIPTFTGSFREAYAVMLTRILAKYKTAEVWCCTFPSCTINENRTSPEVNRWHYQLNAYNDAVRELCEVFGVKVLEHATCGLTYENMDLFMGDWDAETGLALHPNAEGHSLIANNDIQQMDPTCRIRYK